MTTTTTADLPNVEQLSEAVSNVAAETNEMMTRYLEHQRMLADANPFDPMGIGSAFVDFTQKLMSDPDKLVKAQVSMMSAYFDVWNNASKRWLGMDVASPTVSPARDDRRFRHEDWSESPFFDFIKQSYLVAAESVQELVADVDGLDDKTKHKVEFYTKQFVDAMAPTNFVATNPEVLRTTVETGGQNLVNGLQNFMRDFDQERGMLRTRMTDESAFELGRNVAASPGKVIFRNRMFELLQFTPSTEQVYKRPLLIMPPWINKFYILDLQPKNSLIKWLVDQGRTVFVISWVNPDESMSEVGFEDYMKEGTLTAVSEVLAETGEPDLDIVGYCIGGTLLGATLAYMRAQNDQQRVNSATFFTALLDFSEPGDLGVFIDEKQLENLDKQMSEKGYLDGTEMASTFNMLRSNDLIWSFMINNYLLGKDPFPFDLLYWNSDSTRMPRKMHKTYLKRMYIDNALVKPGEFVVDGVPVDLRTIQTPAYFISAREDHIAPWRSTFYGAQNLSGPVRFVLGKSGHIAGIVNPPAANKYGYFTGGDIHGLEPEQWFDKTEEHEGSWWLDWHEWLKRFGEDMVPARTPGAGGHDPLEDAPGAYVRVRI